jgi:RNA polymerase sigma-70 factor, ECF subfamily
MRNILNLPYEEIARALGINVGTVKSRIARARENLRQLLSEAAPEFDPEAGPGEFFVNSRNAYGCPAIAYA